MRRVADLPFGPLYYRVVCCDSDHDSLPEIMFNGLLESGYPCLEFWEHQGWNRFRLVYADTGTYPPPNGISTWAAIPYDAGDLNGDGLTSVVCTNVAYFNPDSVRDIVMTLESPDSFSYPTRLSWYYRSHSAYSGDFPAYIVRDLDHDGHNEIVGWLEDKGTCIWKNFGHDQNELKWTGDLQGVMLNFRDFDGDGKMDIAVGPSGDVWEDTGNCQPELIWNNTFGWLDGNDAWSTTDIDGDSRPEFYISYFDYALHRMYLCMYQSDGNGGFTHTLADSLTYIGTDDWGRASAGGDIDGDGVDECIWTTYDSVRVYKAFGHNDLRKVWEWQSDHHPPGYNALYATVYDVNNDGYNELLLAGNSKISIFEVDAIDLLSPNGGWYHVGDTMHIRWKTNLPPQCSTVSLFARLDTLGHMRPIRALLSPTDSLCDWIIPQDMPESIRIVAMAYGPGGKRQFDMSDSAVWILGGYGVAEGTHKVPLQWSLSVSPNPARGAFSVRYEVPDLGHNPNSLAELGYVPRPVSLGVYDADGRLVRSLRQGNATPGRYEAKLPSGALPAGIYFLRLDAPGFRVVKKAVVTR
ncbi:MAG TPA: FG-GAP-like repeat-containing protein [bacterium]|nr:FG-GAP-like repeat-containing protein [bacterium]